MSADNWAHCPRCTQQGQAKLDERGATVNAQYGKIPVDEFDEARRQYAAVVLKFEQRERTFREDYEVHGAKTGIVTVEYAGHCTKCKLSLNFTDVHTIPGLD
jgi:hypothetical protein